MKTLVFRLLLLAGVLCLLAGCAATEGMPASFHWVTASAASIDKAQSSTPTVEVPLLPLSNGKALTAREVFAQVAPAVVFVETPHASGSAVLVQPGYLL